MYEAISVLQFLNIPLYIQPADWLLLISLVTFGEKQHRFESSLS
ncbi:hypothetical protein VCRA2128O305_260051 [Vibrio crassostreae]|nr:hypothetical protein VCRA2116O233_280051 [Vibrio crassostreae]CAK2589306.1 hypothetical protein VCRA2110O3_170038 [Vibrio crassostreae]CAK2744766.1 hypothetical protein VCRA2119O244_250014 [Vibrio crassostreae]CAK2870152.1 hypothetical protein VCRA2133O313_250051 [Vibrio crassostreae]CAK2899659.1 hypothetical protein VCRA2127O303_290014 [Vibrio crassostreae]